jgi:hypothetical protein
MRPSTPLHYRDDAVRLQIEQVHRARRLLERSVEASAATLGGAASTHVPARPRLRLLSLFSVAALAAVVYPQRMPPQAPRTLVAREAIIATPPAAPTVAETSPGPISAGRPLTIHIRATRPCRVRVVVDGTPLEWRPLLQGDEFFSRPRQQFIIESDDGGALSASVNGVSMALAPDGRAIAFRFTPERPFPDPIPLR